mmetsp:Transcript_23955/g.46703  ORF Transcript_23955/g.46703 Transcript_23955/m.46703 type:complete len:108 (-) Transcript_23955:166-489(-)
MMLSKSMNRSSRFSKPLSTTDSRRNIYSAPYSGMGAEVLPLSPESAGQKMYWKALREMAGVSPTLMGTRPGLTWTKVSDCSSKAANDKLRARYEYDDSYFTTTIRKH